ncbi:MAG: DUF2188 domain-containing protein [Rubrobacter sp.]
MSERKAYHVTPHSEGGWKVEAEAATRASSTHQTKEEAVDNAKELAKAQEPGQVIIHRQDGTIEAKQTYG